MDFWKALDETEVEPSQFKPLDEGIYNVTVHDVQCKEDQDDISVTVEFQTMDKRSAFWFFRLNQGTSFKKLAFIKSQVLKLSGLKSTKGDPYKVLTDCLGKSARIEIKYNEYNGKTYQNIYIKDSRHTDEVPF